MGIAALLGLMGVVATPTAPWSLAGVLVLFGVAGLWEPRLFRVGVVAAWTAGIDGAGWWLLLPALGLGAIRWNRAATGIVALALLMWARQGISARELPAATEVVPRLVVTLVLAASAWAAASPRPEGRWPWTERRALVATALVGGALVLGVRLGRVFASTGLDRLRAADRIQAVPLVYDGLVAGVPSGPPTLPGARLLATLVQRAPDRDGAALRLPQDTALGLGWRPQGGGDAIIPLALALEVRGRGGEALRLLARRPRVDAVDWYRGLLERTQGDVVRWRGGVAPGVATLPGRVALDLTWDTNAYLALPLHVVTPLAGLMLTGEGTAFEGDPVVEVRLDDGETRSWVLVGPSRLTLPGPIAIGPHRVELRFSTDRVGSGGDRNVHIEAISTE